MGHDTHCYAAIGYLIPLSHLLAKIDEKVRIKCACKDADNNKPSFNYCPACGKKLIQEWWTGNNVDNFYVANFPVLTLSLEPYAKFVSQVQSMHVIICVNHVEADMFDTASNRNLEVSSQDGNSTIVSPIMIDSVDASKQKIKQVLEPLGLWKESNFGCFAIRYDSY